MKSMCLTDDVLMKMRGGMAGRPMGAITIPLPLAGGVRGGHSTTLSLQAHPQPLPQAGGELRPPKTQYDMFAGLSAIQPTPAHDRSPFPARETLCPLARRSD